MADETGVATYDGVDAAALGAAAGVPRVELRDVVGSVLDLAHSLAADGAPAGTLVLADSQTAGRGRGGKSWASPAGAGIWLTLLERPNDATALDVLSLRIGLRAAAVLDRYAAESVRLKWPNDLYVAGRKLAGILVEARWRDHRVEWVAIGVGINVRAPADVPTAAGLAPGARRIDILAELVPALRAAAFARGPLTERELTAFAERDLARGRTAVVPVPGVVRGIDERGALLIACPDGTVAAARAGSLLFAEEQQP